MAELKEITFEEFGPYRFLGKSVYARAGAEQSGQIFGSLWENSAWVFEKLDSMKEYATEETNNAALITGDKYDEEKQLLGYTVGRFMRADAPVPEGMDFFDLPAMYVAKGWVTGEFDDMIGSAEGLTMEAIDRQTEYQATWQVVAEVYSKETVAEEGACSTLGYYIGCKKA